MKDIFIKVPIGKMNKTLFREFYIGKYKAFLMYIDGMADKRLLSDFILETLMIEGNLIKGIKDIRGIKDKILTVTDIREEMDLSKAIISVLSGDTILLIDDGSFLCTIGRISYKAFIIYWCNYFYSWAYYCTGSTNSTNSKSNDICYSFPYGNDNFYGIRL